MSDLTTEDVQQLYNAAVRTGQAFDLAEAKVRQLSARVQELCALVYDAIEYLESDERAEMIVTQLESAWVPKARRALGLDTTDGEG